MNSRNVFMGIVQIVVGLVLLGNGLLRPDAIWSAAKFRRIRDNLGDGVTTGVFVLFGLVLIVVGAVMIARSRR